MPIDLVKLGKVLDDAQKIIGHPMTKAVLTAVLPKLGLTAEEIAMLDTHHADLVQRKARARKRAGR